VTRPVWCGFAADGRDDPVGWLDSRRIRYFMMRRGRMRVEEADDWV
jgi:hypothetical protein